MPALVTDQFRILSANNFIDSVSNESNSYYVFLGNPKPTSGFGGSSSWNTNTPNPIDNYDYLSNYRDNILFGRKIKKSNVKRVIRRIDWVRDTAYEMYRNDYSITNRTPLSDRSRLYDSNYYVINSEYKVYICIDNGSSGINLNGNRSLDEPNFTDLEPSKAGESGDGYIWKYLFTVSPSDIVKFDSTEYITVPNDWETTTDPQIVAVRENGDSTVNNNQIKKVYIKNGGLSYNSGEVDILGDGTGGRVFIEVNSSGSIISATVTSGGKGYTYGIVDLGSLRGVQISNPAELVPIIPPSKGHGYDIYKELGTDKVLVYARFDDSTKDFPIDTQFSQIGIIKDLTKYTSSELYTNDAFSALFAIKLSSVSDPNVLPIVGEVVKQGSARAYVASYDPDTKVLKCYKNRSLNYNPTFSNQIDYTNVSIEGNANINFSSSGGSITCLNSGFSGSIDSTFTQSSVTVGSKIISLDTQFTNGLANSEINKKTGDIIYIDNRPVVTRNSRQKEDVKIILEF